MGFLIFLLFVAVIWLVSELVGVKARLTNLDEKFFNARDQLNTLRARVQHLEGAHIPEAAREAAPPPPAPAPDAAPMPVIAPAPEGPPAPVAASAPKEAPAPLETPTLEEAPEPEETLAPASWPAPRPEPIPVPVAAAVSVEPGESWEMVVGTSWLNKIGVLVSIIGVALLVSYSFARIGPAGRVAIGYALSFAMLGGGVWLERRAMFRNYAYGLIAGGWAGVYFTTFAMHDVPAARIIDSDILAVSLLSLVAAGMIAHSLRYKSQVVTSLAFVVGYATLALSPMSGFALAASVPLAVAMLAVAQYFGWSGVAVLGIASAYGTFVLRSEVFPGAGLDRTSPLPYFTLGSYWLAFEAAEIVAIWRRAKSAAVPAGAPPVQMLVLNAIGFVGAVIVTAPGDNPELFSTFLFGTSAAYLVSAAIRARLAPAWRARPGVDAEFGSTHAATLTAAVLTAAAIGLRFSGNRENLARLLEAQMLVTAGLTLGDVWLRRLGSIALVLAAGVAWLHATTVGIGAPAISMLPWSPGTTTAVLALVALAAYGNREALHRRGELPVWLEGGFTWAATVLVSTAIVQEFAPAHQAIAGLVLAALLLEAGFRRDREYIHQSYLVGAVASYAMLMAFLVTPDETGFIVTWGQGPTSLDEWLVLPAGIVLNALMAWRLRSQPAEAPIPGRLVAAGAAATLASAILVLFEWRVLSPNAIAPAWALTAAGLVALGGWRREEGWRWQGYVLALAATVRAAAPLLERPPAPGAETAAIALVIAAVYTAAYLGRRALSAVVAPDAKAGNSLEAAAVTLLSVAATGSFVAFKWRVLPELLVAPAWAATGLVLLSLGIYRGRPGQRWQGYALMAVGSARVTMLLLEQPAPALDATVWAASVVAMTYAAAWTARRFAERTKDATLLLQALPAIGTVVLAVLQWRVVGDLQLGPAWTATAVVFLAIGLWRQAPDLRWQSYALLFAGALRASRPVFTVEEASSAAVAWLAAVIVALYVCGLVVRKTVRAADANGAAESSEDAVGAGALLGATALLAALLRQQVRPSAVTLAVGLEGLALMFTGLVARERILRLSGLALLGACILKLFVYDLRELEALARILSFVILGLSLLAISWTYTRYKEQIRKFL